MHHFRWMACGVVMGTALVALGCGSGEEYRPYEPGAPKQAEGEHDHHGHDHHGHDHGTGPHGGHVLVLGDEEYHAEITFDQKARKLTVYLLGADGKSAQPIEASELKLTLETGETSTSLRLAATPLEGEEDGRASRFEAAAGNIPEQIQDEEDLHGQLDVTIGEQNYSATIEHHHGHGHDHDHGHEHGHNH